WNLLISKTVNLSFTLAKVVKCNSDREAWLIIHNCIYVTISFLNEHPAGRNATESFEVVGHSMDAKQMLKQYLIGEVHPDGHKPDNSKVPSPFHESNIWMVRVTPSWDPWFWSLLIPACLIKHCQQPLCSQVSYKK
uniref:Cytochrome b5 heme-binding domain-containing protein n=1 Tax=Laticauda laticaudata TaxID=8630 RepID=A0A8C5S002_LATLA